MVKTKILVVDDEQDIRELVELNLARDGYEMILCESGQEALDLARSKLPNLIVLDLMLPDIDGLEVCKALKRDSKTEHIPILMLTARGEEADIVIGLELGADDYVTKPFSGKVLAARVRRLLRRSTSDAPENECIKIHGLTIDPARREVFAGETSVTLTFTEFNILHLLARRPGLVFTRYKIVDVLHGNDYLVTDRAVDVQIVSLRRKLGDFGSLIETVRGVGYRFKD
jgi:two-component system phosphate regulon response regulator PhoB